jgi:hypothetical protein
VKTKRASRAGRRDQPHCSAPDVVVLEDIRRKWHKRIAACEKAADNGHPCARSEAEAIRDCACDIAMAIRRANAHPHGRAPARHVQGVVGASELEGTR